MTPRLDLYSLRLFVTVSQTRNLAQAATLEHIAPSALSKRISDLESTLRTTLFHRLRRGVEPTPAGAALFSHAVEILRGVERAELDLSDFTRGVRGQVTIWANITSILQFLPADLVEFTRLHPDIVVSVNEASTPAIVRAVNDGIADVGICVCSMVSHRLQATPYRRDRMVLVVPIGHPLAERESVTFDEVLDYDFVGLRSEQVWTSYMTTAARRAGKPLRMRIRVPSFDAIVRMVEVGLGISVAPVATIEREVAAGSITAVDLNEDWAHRTLELCHRETAAMSVSARMLLQHLEERAAK